MDPVYFYRMGENTGEITAMSVRPKELWDRFSKDRIYLDLSVDLSEDEEQSILETLRARYPGRRVISQNTARWLLEDGGA